MSNQNQDASPAPEPSPTPVQSGSRPRQPQRRRQQRPTTSNPTSYVGENESVGVILALRSERFDKKVSFQEFTDKVANYVVINFKDGGDIQPLFTDLIDPTSEFQAKNKPIKPEGNEEEENPDEVDLEIYKEEVKQFVQRKMNLRRNLEKSYGLIWGQCSAGLQAYVKGTSAYATMSVIFNVVWLLHELKKATSGIDDKANIYVNMHDAMSMLYKMRQGTQETNDHFLARFKANVTAVKLTGGGHIFFSPKLVGMDKEDLDQDKVDEEEERSKAVLLLKLADEGRYGALSNSLKEGTFLDRDEYPTTVATMYELMTKHSGAISGQRTQGSGNRRSGFQLVQQGQCLPVNEQDEELIPGTDGRIFQVICYNCNKKGHYASCCPEPSTRVGASNLQVGNLLTQVQQQGLIPPDWILLDTCSTDNVVNSRDMIRNIKPCTEEDSLKIYTNGGALDYDQVGDFAYLPIKIYYNPQ